MLNLSGIAIQGVSIAGVESCVQLPGFDLCFDIGRSSRTAIQYPLVLVTHGHMDHMGGIAMHAATRALMGMPAPTYIVPAEYLTDLKSLFAVWRRLDGSRLPSQFVPARPGDRIPIGPDREVRAFRTLHPVPSLGYAVCSRKRKLKEEYVGLTGEAIRDLRLSGVEVAREVWTPDVTYVGDSLYDVLATEPLCQESRVLLLEVTFLDDRVDVAAARSKGHTHLDEIIARPDLLVNPSVVFCHFSARYTLDEIREILARRTPDVLRSRVHHLLPSRDRGGRQGASRVSGPASSAILPAGISPAGVE